MVTPRRTAAMPPKLSSRAQRGIYCVAPWIPRCARDDSGRVARTSPSMTHSQIGLDHGTVGLDRVGHAVADFLAVVENHDPVGDVHHHAHVVLDQADR